MSVVRNCIAAMLASLATCAVGFAQPATGPQTADAMIPALGFNLAATVTMPPTAAKGVRHPAVILIPGSGPVDRDETVGGVPIFAQLAPALAQQGYLVVRYDKRGVGKSGGRDESATLEDYASDVLSAFRWLRKRKDVDKNRISVAGRGEGGWVAMIAGAREEDVRSVVLIGTAGVKGADLVLEQQRDLLDSMRVEDAERKAKTELQQQINAAVLTGAGWDALPADVRRRADTPWFRSLLEFDPARWMRRVRQPLLIVHGELDRQVRPHHADTLAQLGRQRNRKASLETVHLPGVNHLLVRETAGEGITSSQLAPKAIVADIAGTIGAFLRRS